jgi:hypothetical protein
METATVFERRSERAGIVSMRVSPAERRELERLARQAGATISDVLRDGLAHVRQLRADAECAVGSE